MAARPATTAGRAATVKTGEQRLPASKPAGSRDQDGPLRHLTVNAGPPTLKKSPVASSFKVFPLPTE